MDNKNSTFILLIVIVVLLLVNTILLASKQYVLNGNSEQRGTISSSETVKKQIKPDTVSINIAVETMDMDAQKSSSLNKEKADSVVSVLKSMINNKTDTVKTANYSVKAEYKYNKDGKKLIGYRTKNEIHLKTKQIDKLGEIIDKATQQGANSINRIDFSISDDEKFCNELMAQAAKKSRQKAQIIAKSLDSKIIGIQNSSFSCGSQGVMPRFQFSESNLMHRADSQSTPIEPGTLELNAHVRTVFYVE